MIQQRELQLDEEERVIRQRAAKAADREAALDRHEEELGRHEERVNR